MKCKGDLLVYLFNLPTPKLIDGCNEFNFWGTIIFLDELYKV